MSKPKLVHVPTVPELEKLGLAKSPASGARWKIKPKGQAMIDDAMAHNANILKPLVDDVAAKKAEYDKARRKLAKLEATRR